VKNRIEFKVQKITMAVALAIGVPAFAQNAAPVLEEVVVTATHREMSSQDVAASLSAVGEAQLRSLRIRNADDLQNYIPNLSIKSSSIGTADYNIRGVGQAVDDISVESGVGVYIDGIYVPRTGPAGGILFDLARVEVLRGPQGTLYGRNSAGGSISYVSREPDYEFGGEFSVEAAEFGTFNAKGYLTGPIIEDKLLAKLSLVSLESDGYMENVYDGSDGSGVSTQAIRLGTKYIISDRSELNVTVDYQENDPNPRMFSLLEPGFRSVIHDLAPDYPSEPANEGFYEADIDNTGFEEMDSGGIMARLNVEHDNMDSVYLFGYRNAQTRFDVDRDHSPVSLFNEAHDEDTDWGSAEIRFTSQRDGDWSFGGKADWLLGLYYFQEDGTRDVSFYTDVFVLFFGDEIPFPTAEVNFYQGIETEAMAIFGEFTYDLSDVMRITAGARYTDEEKTFSGRTEIIDPTVDFFFPGFPGLLAPGSNGIVDEIYDTKDTTSWDDSSFKLALEYDFGEATMAYALFSQGFKSGGYQGTGATSEISTTPFDPENVDNYELGLKSTFFDQRLQSNMSAFYMDYTNLQNFVVTDSGTPQTLNADAEIQGFEWELIGLPSDSLRLGLSLGYLDSEYTEFEGSPERVGDQVNGVPDFKYSIFGDYYFSALGGEITLHADYVWEEETTDSLGASAIPQWEKLNLSVAYLSGNGNWELIGWVQNATDEEYWLENSIAASSTPPEAVPRMIAPPRTIGATLNYRFGSQL
jgi:iron complex outermembrane receptor protein